ncbi:hypothetical protein P153DRAFT_289407 [Dothidotthia symphoricarpi CBS 119687]|uniref:Transcription factor Nrm1/Whi5 n=1 Tax=Dothidotthia symphoricarpi CBS 119687 TaxID=1392245 RepID=A0A6A6AFU4_9PLEO|nr:uncharacterized protein P153DRAFT_289407 [Dothidotthia symphoricarpi CBS 119687]KAF2129807.1 hypothetical protein P153DRAFT_289407 [Dothidotthia symphoricarpi CBS 119687]
MAEQDDVATKVLRRAQVSKMTRTLQNRLALANVKIKNGWESLSLDAIEPRVDVELKRKRPGSSNEAMSDVSSVSERFYQPSVLDSSPLAAPIFSDAVRRSGTRSASSHSHDQSRRLRHNRSLDTYPASSNHTRKKARSLTTASTSWKNDFKLPESSPAYHRRHARFGRTHVPSLSFVSETSTIPDDPRSPLLSEDDDEDLPISSFQLTRSHVRSSPPRAPQTPPPNVARSARLRQRGFTAAGAAREGKMGDEDAGLLVHLDASPTPVRAGSVRTLMPAPSTPPPLPSSMMSTPGGGGAPFAGFALGTPSNNLNFNEFLNMSPSPAQITGSWNRTPITGRTPAAVREARRRLNFDNFAPPTGDGSQHSSRIGKHDCLGMELGGELIS